MADKDARLTGTPPADEAHSVRGGAVLDLAEQIVVGLVSGVGSGVTTHYVLDKMKPDAPKGKHHKPDGGA